MQKKRWYQMSMLQMLVAMAVVAMLVWLNRPVPYWLEFDVSSAMAVEDSQGWPINFRQHTWTAIPVIVTPNDSRQAAIPLPSNTDPYEISLLPLLADIAIGALIITGAIVLVGQFGKRKMPCPSTST